MNAWRKAGLFWLVGGVVFRGVALLVMFVCFQDETIGPDPFYDLEQHALLGVANFYLECVNHGVKHDYAAPIVAPTGKVLGQGGPIVARYWVRVAP